MNKFEEFNKDLFEFFCRECIAKYIRIWEPDDFHCYGCYLTIDINKEKDWYFDIAVGENRESLDENMLSVGFAEGDCTFYWLYRFDPEEKPGPFSEENWNPDEFEFLVHEFSRDGKLQDLYRDLYRLFTRHETQEACSE